MRRNLQCALVLLQAIFLLALCVPPVFAIQSDASGTRFPFLFQKERTTLHEFFDDLSAQRGYVSEDAFTQKVNEVTGHNFKDIQELSLYYHSNEGVEIKSCSEWNEKGIPSGVYIMYANDDGTEFGTWEREGDIPCSPGEYIVYDKGRPVFSLYCGNVIISPVPPIVVAPVVQELVEVAMLPPPPPPVAVQTKPERTCRQTSIAVERQLATVFVPHSAVFSGGTFISPTRIDTMFSRTCE